MSKISVIIPIYNEEKFIEQCLVSLKNQNYENFEIILVDDGSYDGTLEIINNFKKSNKNISLKLLEQNHMGPGVARNLGASVASGNIFVFVDADMTFDKNFLRMLIAPINKGHTKGTFSKYEYVSNWENVWARCLNINENWPKRRRHKNNYPDHQKVFRAILASEFKKAGGFTPGGYTDDWSLSEKLGYEAINASKAIFYHKNPDSLKEVFLQGRWSSKRKYKLGLLGVFINIVRSSLIFSITIGIFKSIVHMEPRFFIFKLVYDIGYFVGLLQLISNRKLSK